MPATATRRDWMQVGEKFAEYRAEIEREIESLTFAPPGAVGYAPGYAIRECIAQFGMPKPSAIATDGCLEVGANAEAAAYGVYGIEANYKNARIRLYVLDDGLRVTPLAADVWPPA